MTPDNSSTVLPEIANLHWKSQEQESALPYGRKLVKAGIKINILVKNPDRLTWYAPREHPSYSYDGRAALLEVQFDYPVIKHMAVVEPDVGVLLPLSSIELSAWIPNMHTFAKPELGIISAHQDAGNWRTLHVRIQIATIPFRVDGSHLRASIPARFIETTVKRNQHQ
jgi:hypothetical protein